MTTHRELSGQLGRYAILRKIGAGGMGSVYLAEDTVQPRRVALKVPHPNLAARHALERFRREATLAAGIVGHPHLCPVYTLEEVNGIVFFTMPYIEGTPLSRLIERGKPWPVAEAVELVRKVAGAVEHLHAHGILHRDLKPSNVMVLPSVEPVLMDFGLALDLTSEETRLTKMGTTLGSPAHMAPEQVAMKKRIGPAVDVYGLGLLLYELVTSRLPFEQPTPGLFMQILHDPPPPPSSINRALDPRLDALCLQALSKKPEDRQPSAAAFAAELSALPAEALAPKGPTEEEAPGTWRLWCPRCGKALRVSDKYLGRKVRCPRCQSRLGRLQPPGTQPAAPPVQDTAARDDSPTAEMMQSDVVEPYDESGYGELAPRLRANTLWLIVGFVTLFVLLSSCLLMALLKT